VGGGRDDVYLETNDEEGEDGKGGVWDGDNDDEVDVGRDGLGLK